jgi:hypothetical protein
MSNQGEAKNCRQCKYSRNDLVPGAQQMTFCTRFPPQVVFIPGDMRNAPQVNALYPQVQPDIPCGEWRPAVPVEATVTPIRPEPEPQV